MDRTGKSYMNETSDTLKLKKRSARQATYAIDKSQWKINYVRVVRESPKC